MGATDVSMKSSGFVRFKSAMFDGGAEGRNAVLRKIAASVTRFLDSSLGPRWISTNTEMPKCVLICCPPRTGSTFIYQVLARVVPCAFVANIHQLAPRLGQRLFPFQGAPNFHSQKLKSFYGHTRSLWDVNEGNELVDYWFQDDRTEGIRSRFQETLSWIGASGENPAILKNVAVYDRLARLHEAVPELLYLRIVRDRQQSIESSVRAYRDLGYMNPIPEGLDTSEHDRVKLIADQVELIETRISTELSSVPDSSVLNWEYEAFCENPQDMISDLCRKIDVVPNWIEDLFPLSKSTRKKVSEEDTNRISALLGR